METVESLKRKIAITQELQSVVRTMKAMAAVSIRQFQRAASALESYNETVELGLQIALWGRSVEANAVEGGTSGAVVFGSDQGMCGQFNVQIASFFERESAGPKEVEPRVIALGSRLAADLALKGCRLDRTYGLPGSVKQINAVVFKLVLAIERWQADENVVRVELFHNRQKGGASFESHRETLIPVRTAWLQALQERPWKTRVIPLYTMEYAHLLPALVRQYLFVTIYRSFAESLAAENAARLAAMQAAERNVDERLRDLNLAFQQERQTAITAELLDIVAGFEALTGGH
jgi:F-type H+-transporting ATPase subunit gamma